MHPQQHSCLFIDGAFVVGNPCTVGGTYLSQSGARFSHDLRYAEGTTDLDQLTARHDNLSAFRQRIKRQHYGGCTVVYDHGVYFVAGRRIAIEQLRQQPLNMYVALASLSAGEIELEIGVSPCNLLDMS